MAKYKKSEVRDSSYPLADSPKPTPTPTPEQKARGQLYAKQQAIQKKVNEVFKGADNDDSRFYKRQLYREAGIPQKDWK
jgi:hypothetical protein